MSKFISHFSRSAGPNAGSKSHRDFVSVRAGRANCAFTLIELLTVVAIIAILAAILIPTTASARSAAKRAKTRAHFAQWGAAIESFRQEYGYYPTFETTGAGMNKVNGNTAGGTNLGQVHRFYEILVGTRRDGQQLTGATTGNPPPPLAQNTRRIAFITFTEADMVPVNTTDATLTSKRGLVRDAFDNTDIAVLVDRNLDGSIKYSAAGGDGINTLPFVSPMDATTVRLQPNAADFPTVAQGGVRAGVIFYCAPPGARQGDQSLLIMSWK
ncbi:MAG: prepilin-type N-terminal cleavage/methylation domain-containing protein [Opitutaceae bacterium]|nr:prepilin-type N-terminal cleavage/methylation domain-containing protein [Opitutaceae bacterium]